jgi:hypothetical protein
MKKTFYKMVSSPGQHSVSEADLPGIFEVKFREGYYDLG